MKMKENKKRYMIAIVAFAIFAVLFALGLKANSLYSSSLSNKQMSEQENQGKSSPKVSKDSANADKSSKNGKVSSSVKSSPSGGKSSEVPSWEKGSSSDSSSQTSSPGGSSSKADNPSTVTPSGVVKVSATDPESRATFQVIDTVHGNKMILAKNIDKSMDGETVGYITERILDDAKINYKATGAVSTLYFAAIDGLEEKKAGKLSGWCYYIRKKGDNVFHKPNIGCGQWVWHSGDVVVWRYLADGIYDGYEGEWERK